MLASVAEQASLSLTWSETAEDMFSHDEAHINSSIFSLNAPWQHIFLKPKGFDWPYPQHESI